jgi:hypothetical protein
VRRDVERLRELGYQVAATRGRDGGYRLDAGAELPPLLFDDEQVVALAVALRTAAVSGAGAGIEEAAVRALTTVRQVLPTRLRHRVDTVEVTAVARDPSLPTAPLDLDVLLAVSAAVRRREVLRFDYAPPAPPVTAHGARSTPEAGGAVVPARRVEPHHVVVRERRWYLVAWDLDRADWRTFRLDRLSPRVPTGPRFARREVPGGDVRAFVAARFSGSDEGGAWPCVGWVELSAEATAVAPFVEDGVVVDLGPGRSRLELGSWSWVALAARVAAFDADLVAVGPRELVEACGVVAARLRGLVPVGSAAPGRDAPRQPLPS